MQPDAATIDALFPAGLRAHRLALAADAGGTPDRHGIVDHRLHFFLAQIGHETAGLTVVAEEMSYRAARLVTVWPRRFPSEQAALPFARAPERLAERVYGGRLGNGPEGSGDGFRFRGRGYLQLTGRDTYREVGAIAGMDLEANPERAAAPGDALRVACAYWHWKNLNALCDTGDFARVTRRINGGLIGLADRRAWLDKVRRVLAPAVEAISPAEAVAVQRALQGRRYTEIGAADGRIGPRTLAALTRFRLDHGLPPGGIDVPLKRALGLV